MFSFLSRNRTRPPTFPLLLIAIPLFLAAQQAQAQYGRVIRERAGYSFSVAEFQPDTRLAIGQFLHGGVVRTIAVHPTDITEFTIATTSGGLFRSNDSGVTWRHLGNPGPWNYSLAVAYDPNNPSVMLATTSEDYSQPPTGGIWRSTDRGETWAQPETGRLQASWRCIDRLNAYAISFDPSRRNRVFVATNCGILSSVDGGLVWTRTVPGGGDPRFTAILALRGDRIVAGGLSGIWYWRSVGGVGVWTRESTGIGSMTPTEMNGFAVSPYNSSHVFAVMSDLRLYQSTNSGESWSLLETPPGGGGGCGGTGLVKAIRTPTRDVPDDGSGRSQLTIYFGNQCSLFRKDVFSFPGSSLSFDFPGASWREDAPCHADTHDLVFDRSNRPMLLATDGGVETRTGPSGICPTSWAHTGGVQNGLSALQVSDVAGQQVLNDAGEPSRYDLYIGTMHNDLWASTNNGRSWGANDNFEGGLFRMHRRIREAHARITYFRCAGCVNKEATAGLASKRVWTNPNATSPMGVPELLPLGTIDSDLSYYLQYGHSGMPADRGLYFTPNGGGRWDRITPVAEQFAGYPHVFGGSNPVVYVSLRVPGTGTLPTQYRLLQVSEMFDDILRPRVARVVRPNMYFAARCEPGTTSTQSVSLAWHTTAFFWWPVFAVDPGDPNRLIAVDVNSQNIVETRNGGECWQPMARLTQLVTSSGRYRLFLPFPFSTGDDGIRSSLVSSITFNPDAPEQILVGTMQNGIFFTSNGGRTWSGIPNTARITHTPAMHWQSDDTVLVASYGRGLWKLNLSMTTTTEIVFDLCRVTGCGLIDARSRRPVPLGEAKVEEVMLIINGRLVDVESGTKMTLTTTPGSSLVFATHNGKAGNIDLRSVRQEVQPKSGAKFPPLTNLSPNQIPIGLAFEKGEVKYVLTAKEPLQAERSKVVPLEKIQGIKGTYVDKVPSISIHGGAMPWGYPILTRRRELTVVGRNFQRDVPVRVRIDEREVPSQVRVDQKGSFEIKLKVDKERLGKHTVSVTQQLNPNNIQSDTTFFIITPDDEKEK